MRNGENLGKTWGKLGDVREISTFSWTSSPNNRFESDVKRLAPFQAAQAVIWLRIEQCRLYSASRLKCRIWQVVFGC